MKYYTRIKTVYIFNRAHYSARGHSMSRKVTVFRNTTSDCFSQYNALPNILHPSLPAANINTISGKMNCKITFAPFPCIDKQGPKG